MKKFLTVLALSFIVIASVYNPVQAENVEKQELVTSEEVVEGVELIHEDDYDVQITTRIASLDEYLDELENQGIEATAIEDSAIDIDPINTLNSDSESLASYSTASYTQEDYMYGSGQKTDTRTGLTGQCWSGEIFIGLNAIGGIITGNIFANVIGDSSAYSKPRVTLTTWGLVGGTIGVIKEYVFTNSSYSTGVVSFGMNSNLTGSVAYYSISLYGDHKKGTSEWTSNATLTEY